MGKQQVDMLAAFEKVSENLVNGISYMLKREVIKELEVLAVVD
jgi:hypothetical protein